MKKTKGFLNSFNFDIVKILLMAHLLIQFLPKVNWRRIDMASLIYSETAARLSRYSQEYQWLLSLNQFHLYFQHRWMCCLENPQFKKWGHKKDCHACKTEWKLIEWGEFSNEDISEQVYLKFAFNMAPLKKLVSTNWTKQFNCFFAA